MAPGPPIALLHGFATSFDRTWRDNGWVDLISEADREVVKVDLLGHGSADKPHDPDGYRHFESHALAQLPDVPVDAIGFSMGARTLLYLAATEPQRFSRVVVAGVGANLFTRDREHGETIAAAVSGDVDPENPEAQHFAALASTPDSDPAALAALMQRRDGPDLTAELLAAISAPCLVVLGDQDFAGPADPLIDTLADVRLVTLRGVDHFATPKSFDFIDAALDFLDAAPF